MELSPGLIIMFLSSGICLIQLNKSPQKSLIKNKLLYPKNIPNRDLKTEWCTFVYGHTPTAQRGERERRAREALVINGRTR